MTRLLDLLTALAILLDSARRVHTLHCSRMPVDRAGRDRLASTLAAYLRGEADNFALDEAGAGAGPTDDATLRSLGRAIWFCYDDFRRHPVSATPQEWELLCRTIAFLKTDLEFAPAPVGRWRCWHRRQWAGLAALAVLLLSTYLACTRSAGWLLLPGFAVGVPMSVACLLRRDGPDDAVPQFYPFRDEPQWRLHAHLLDHEHLPPYDPARHGRPIRGRFAHAVLTLPGYALAPFIVLPLLAPLMLFPRDNHGPAK